MAIAKDYLWNLVKYINDPQQHFNESKVRSLLQVIFVEKIDAQEGLLKARIKTSKFKGVFGNLHTLEWKRVIMAKWSAEIEPELIDHIKQVKATSNPAARTKLMKELDGFVRRSMVPQEVINMIEADAEGEEPTNADDTEATPEVEDAGPGFLRRAGQYAGGAAKALGAGVGYALMGERGVIGAIAKGAAGLYGLHKTAKAFAAKSAAGSSSSGSRSRGILGGLFKKNTEVRSKNTTDFTPREEQIEGDETTSILQRIEENTAALLNKFGGGGDKEKEGSKGILSTLMGALSKIGDTIGGMALKFGGLLLMAIPVLKSLLGILPGITKSLISILGRLGLGAAGLLTSAAAAIATPVGAALATGVAALAAPSNIFQDTDKIREADENVGKVGQDPSVVASMGKLKHPDKLARSDDARKKVYKVLKSSKVQKQNLTDEQIKGIFGSTGSESNWDPYAENPDSKATGLFQYLGTRKKEYFKFAAKRAAELKINDLLDPQLQGEFMVHELNTTESRAGKNLIASKTAEDAAKSFKFDFERPINTKWTPAEQKRQRTKMSSEVMKHLGKEKFHVNRIANAADAGTFSPSPLTSFDPIPKKSIEGDYNKAIPSSAEESALINAKLLKSREASISPKEADPQQSGGNNTIVISPQASNNTQGGNGTGARPGHKNEDDSLLKLVLDRQSHSFA